MTLTCSKCGKEIADRMHECPHCGHMDESAIKAKALLDEMTPEERFNFVSSYAPGTPDDDITIMPVERLGIPRIHLMDASGGLRIFGTILPQKNGKVHRVSVPFAAFGHVEHRVGIRLRALCRRRVQGSWNTISAGTRSKYIPLLALRKKLRIYGRRPVSYINYDHRLHKGYAVLQEWRPR